MVADLETGKSQDDTEPALELGSSLTPEHFRQVLRARILETPDSDGKLPWDRLPREPKAAYEVFQHYLNSPVRSPRKSLAFAIDQGYLTGETPMNSLVKWRTKYEWNRRAAAFDEDEELERQKWAARARRTAIKRHVASAQVLSEKAMASLQKLAEEAFTPSTVIQALTAAVRIERDALGLSQINQMAAAGLPPAATQLNVQINNGGQQGAPVNGASPTYADLVEELSPEEIREQLLDLRDRVARRLELMEPVAAIAATGTAEVPGDPAELAELAVLADPSYPATGPLYETP